MKAKLKFIYHAISRVHDLIKIDFLRNYNKLKLNKNYPNITCNRKIGSSECAEFQCKLVLLFVSFEVIIVSKSLRRERVKK